MRSELPIGSLPPWALLAMLILPGCRHDGPRAPHEPKPEAVAVTEPASSHDHVRCPNRHWASLERSDVCERSFVVSFDAERLVDCGPYASEAEGREHSRWAQRAQEGLERLPCCVRSASHPNGPEWTARVVMTTMDLFAHRYRNATGDGGRSTGAIEPDDSAAELGSELVRELSYLNQPGVAITLRGGMVIATIATNAEVHGCQ